MINDNKLSSRGAKDLLKIIPKEEVNVEKFAKENNLLQISDEGELKVIVSEIIRENPKAPIQFMVGKAMKKTNNRANPVMLQELFLQMLDH
jgi:aspartyl-tRNA(Asn)/glutamyl-tRNA(Gln) amidotransferase subunit B